MQTTETSRNGVDTETLFATINLVKDQPELASFQFRVANQWVEGTHSQGTSAGFYGAGQEHVRAQSFTYDADHPTVLVGGDNGPTPVEYLLHGLAACLTAGVANVAAARGVDLDEVTSTVEGDIDLRGILGIDPAVRNGYQQITVTFAIRSSAPAEKVRQVVQQSVEHLRWVLG